MSVTLLDAIIVIALIVGFVGGWMRGVLTEICSFIGMIVVVVVAWMLKGHLSMILYRFLPFFKFGGAYTGISSINILVYEMISFLIIAGVLAAILGIILKVTGAFENILKSTVILSIPTRILGGLAGVLEAYIVVFVVLCILSQPFVSFVNVNEDKFAYSLLQKTPLLSHAVNDVVKSGEEIYNLAKDKNKYTEGQLDYKTLEILLKNGIVNSDSVDYLIAKGKIDVSGAKELANKYRK